MRHLVTALLLAAMAVQGSAQDYTSKPRKKTNAAAQQKPTKKEIQIQEVKNAKAAFMATVSSCPRPEACDPDSPSRDKEMVKTLASVEDAFVVACAQCASDKVCEQERARIRSGNGRFGYNPCVPEPAKPAAPASGEKKQPAAEKKPAAADAKGK